MRIDGKHVFVGSKYSQPRSALSKHAKRKELKDVKDAMLNAFPSAGTRSLFRASPWGFGMYISSLFYVGFVHGMAEAESMRP